MSNLSVKNKQQEKIKYKNFVPKVLGAFTIVVLCGLPLIVTNAYFTSAAKKMAEQCNVELWDRDTLQKVFKKLH